MLSVGGCFFRSLSRCPPVPPLPSSQSTLCAFATAVHSTYSTLPPPTQRLMFREVRHVEVMHSFVTRTRICVDISNTPSRCRRRRRCLGNYNMLLLAFLCPGVVLIALITPPPDDHFCTSAASGSHPPAHTSRIYCMHVTRVQCTAGGTAVSYVKKHSDIYVVEVAGAPPLTIHQHIM